MRFLWVFGLVVMAGAPAQALEFRSCDKAQIAIASAAVAGAQELMRASGAAVADDDDFARWFGRYSPSRAEELRAGLKAVARALAHPDLTMFCPDLGVDGCTADVFATVYSDRHYVVNLCAAFFEQPTMAGIVVTSDAFEAGTREGTIIHEVSHFDIVAATEDHCYGRTECMDMAKTNPGLVIQNADTFQYYTEDIVLGGEGRLGAGP
jgi:peptidyl-Lys metalloendopeptidase